MKDLKLSEILRYLATGFVILLVFYYCEPDKAKKLLINFDAIEKSFLLFVLGGISFLLYRTFVYYIILFFILDKIIKDNVRDQLMNLYTLNKRHEAELVWRFLSKYLFSKEPLDFDIPSSEVHLLYISSITTLIGSLYVLCSNLSFIEEKFVVLLGISIITMTAALLYDFRTEKIISMILKSKYENEISAIIEKIGYNKKNSTSPQKNEI